MPARRLLALIVALTAAAGCRSFFVDATVPTIAEISAVGFAKTDLDFMGAALPGSILQLEGLHTVSPDNAQLMLLIAEAKCGYAMGWVERERPDRASQYYLEGKDLALKALYETNGDYADAIDEGKKVHQAVATVDDIDAVPALFTAGNCWANWLNLNAKTKASAMFAQPHIVALMSKVVELDEGYYYGGAHLFFGSYYTTLPAMAGGGLAKGRKHFQKAFELSEEKLLLVHYFYAQTYAAMLKDMEDPVTGKTGEEIFDEMIAEIRDTPADVLPEMAMANAMAKDKAEHLAAKRDKIF